MYFDTNNSRKDCEVQRKCCKTIKAALLGDTDESDPGHWDEGLGAPDRYELIHALFVIYAVDNKALDEHYSMVLSAIADNGVSVIYRQDAALLDGGKEHFGFRDDIMVLGNH